MESTIANGMVKKVDAEFAKDLELVSIKQFPLPGATFNKGNYVDSRTKLQNVPGLSAGDTLTLYEHIATIRHTKTDKFFVAFRQTMDCLLLEQQDKTKYPDWLMQSANKRTELSIHIYQVKEVNGLPCFPSKMPNLNTHEDWLKQIEDESIFESVAYFLLKNGSITIDMFERS